MLKRLGEKVLYGNDKSRTTSILIKARPLHMFFLRVLRFFRNILKFFLIFQASFLYNFLEWLLHSGEMFVFRLCIQVKLFEKSYCLSNSLDKRTLATELTFLYRIFWKGRAAESLRLLNLFFLICVLLLHSLSIYICCYPPWW